MRVTRQDAPPAPKPPSTYSIEGLTFREAMVVAVIMGAIGGDAKGPRSVTDQIFQALRHAGVNGDFTGIGRELIMSDGPRGTLYLSETWPDKLAGL